VQHAHQKGIIHRDLKPSNILVAEVDGAPVPKVIDFGIAKALHASDGVEAAATQMTQADQLLGTPGYMSPEQIECCGIDTRSDIYSLGGLLYQLLTGATPFESARSMDELRHLIRQTTPERPSVLKRRTQKTKAGTAASTTSADALSPDSDSDLDWITLRALEKTPDRRYQTAAEFAVDVRRFLDGEPVLARPPSLAYVTRLWISRHRTATAAACLVVSALLGGSALALWQARIARFAQHTAELETARALKAEDEAEESLEKSRQTTDFLTGLLDRVISEVKNGRNPEVLTSALAGSEEHILKLTTQPELRLMLLEKIQGIYATLGETKLAVPLARARFQELARLHGPESEAALNAELDHHKLVMDFGARADSPALLEDLKQRVEARGGRGETFWLEVQRTLSRAWNKLDLPDRGVAASEELLAEARAQKLTPRSMVIHQIAHAASLEAAQRHGEALALLKEASIHAAGTVQETRIEEKVVLILETQKRYQDAIQLHSSIVDRQKKIHGEHSPALLPFLKRLADLEDLAGNHETAISLCSEALDIARSQIPEGASGSQEQRQAIWNALLELADSESDGGRHSDALVHGRQALETAKAMSSNSMILKSLHALADFHDVAGDLEASYELITHCLEISRVKSANHLETEQFMRILCDLRIRQQRPHDALALGLQLWSQIAARPASAEEIPHRGQVAETLISSLTAVKASHPEAEDPPELAEWQATIATRQQHRNDLKKLRSRPMN
jgi:tetratricopeptide (TPR) repeat protein